MRLLKLTANVIIWTIPPSIICISITRQWRERFKREILIEGAYRKKKRTDLVRHSRPSISELSVGKSGKMRRHVLNTHTYSYIFLSQLWYYNDVELNTYCPFAARRVDLVARNVNSGWKIDFDQPVLLFFLWRRRGGENCRIDSLERKDVIDGKVAWELMERWREIWNEWMEIKCCYHWIKNVAIIVNSY